MLCQGVASIAAKAVDKLQASFGNPPCLKGIAEPRQHSRCSPCLAVRSGKPPGSGMESRNGVVRSHQANIVIHTFPEQQAKNLQIAPRLPLLWEPGCLLHKSLTPPLVDPPNGSQSSGSGFYNEKVAEQWLVDSKKLKPLPTTCSGNGQPTT